MLEHARNLEFEKAARVRDQLALLREQAFGAAVHDNVVAIQAPAGDAGAGPCSGARIGLIPSDVDRDFLLYLTQISQASKQLDEISRLRHRRLGRLGVGKWRRRTREAAASDHRAQASRSFRCV